MTFIMKRNFESDLLEQGRNQAVELGNEVKNIWSVSAWTVSSAYCGSCNVKFSKLSTNYTF